MILSCLSTLDSYTDCVILGTSYSMYAILVSCLYRRISLLLSLGNRQHYLFLDIGVWELTGELDTLNDSSADEIRRAIASEKTPWALFDGDDGEPAGAFTKAYVFWPVLFVPPDLGHYDAWVRQRNPAIHVMAPMSATEILKWSAFPLNPSIVLNIDCLNQLFRTGGCTRQIRSISRRCAFYDLHVWPRH